jgi:Tubulin binding cofactor C
MLSGALHVTKCSNLELWIQSAHQLRIHESSELLVHIADPSLVAGAILEDSSNVVFYVAADSHDIRVETNFDTVAMKLLDVKDFSWLHRGVPNPNFRLELVPKVSKDVSETKVYTEPEVSASSHSTPATSPFATAVPEQADVDAGEDSDDEL